MKTNYTIGIYFTEDLRRVALILKNRPNWQAGKYNFPGGHIEKDESSYSCIAREFKEECGIDTKFTEWCEIGTIKNKGKYECKILTLINHERHGELKTMEDQPVIWCDVDKLPGNIISNLSWLIPFALNYWIQGNIDSLRYGKFKYD
jgi:8-oxo-dGTP pyrophosphatase MutT (NUDIX family)